MSEAPEAIYRHPQDYELEHLGDTQDIEFFTTLVTRFQPKRVLELACGNGRVTLPLAQAGACEGFEVVGLEMVPEMLEVARNKQEGAEPEVRDRLSLQEGDMRTWQSPTPFDLIVTPCSSVCHLLTLEDQLAAWRCAYQNLVRGGRFVVDIAMADFGSYMDTVRSPPREWVEVDRDTYEAQTQTRLIRSKTTRYFAHEQRARIRYFYDKYVGQAQPERSVSDFESHVYYPREVELLFRHTRFDVEAVYGDYQRQPLKPTSTQMIFIGHKP
jgi:SAM-dependent methyltransferase